MSEYTPSTDAVRAVFQWTGPGDSGYTERGAEFDRWLASERARIWDYCCEAIDNHELNTQQAREGNPFRKVGDA